MLHFEPRFNIEKDANPSTATYTVSAVHPSIHPPSLTMNLNFRQSSQRKREEKGGGGEGVLFSCSRPTLGPHDPAPSPPPLLSELLAFTVSKPSACSFFWKMCHNTNAVAGRGGKRNTWTRIATPALALFDLPFLHLAFQRWWSVNRLWPLMPRLSFVSMWVLMWGGGCTTAAPNAEIYKWILLFFNLRPISWTLKVSNFTK